ncbi:MAG: hypothetical protein KDH15_12240 [Rhodocyclaceae bacterium]|nr:hypothetical protein [Rhodocyclaceae bacterium]
MAKWALLAFSVVAVLGFVQSLRWLYMSRRLPPHEFEKVVGYYAAHLDIGERAARANLSKRITLDKVVQIMAIIALAFIGATVKAFRA